MPKNHVKAKLTKLTCPSCRTEFESLLRLRKTFCSRPCARRAQGGSPGPHKKRPLEDRFWAKVNKAEGQGPKGECWEWIAGKDQHGYGTISWQRAHRVSWELHNGPIPEGLGVLHHCDNPPCIKPSHLFVGTQAENMRDASIKKRWHHQGS